MPPQDRTVSLKEYFEKILIEKDKAINIALQAAEKAVTVAEKNAEKWRDNANEWRGAMSDREKTFATKGELETYKESTEKALKIEKERSDLIQGRGQGLSDGWKIVVGVFGIFSFIATILGIISLLNK